MSRKAYLILENGTYFEGESFGAEKETIGELVFTTAMVGYLETLTDPSYFGQVVLQTFPLIGNYGVIPADFESETPVLNAYICRSWCQEPSNFRCSGNLDTFLREKNVPGLCGIDTRELTKIIREQGVMNCKLTYSLDNMEKDLEEIKAYQVKGAVENTSTKETLKIESENGKYDVVVMDLGAKQGIEEFLLPLGCNVTYVPYNTTAKEIMDLNPDGVVISNGGGNPMDYKEVADEIKKLCENKLPIFGIGLGHQLLAISQGATVEKLHYGHHGASQPAKNLETNEVYITTQNHNYAVVNDSIPENAQLTFVNSNDASCEGIGYKNLPAFSVQFRPQVGGGPRDTSLLFNEFVKMIENK